MHNRNSLTVPRGPGIYRLFRFLLILLAATELALHAAPAAEDIQPGNLADLPLEALMEIEIPTVFAASKFEQKVTAAPSSITVLTSEDVKRYGHRTLGDMLRSVQGFHVSYDRNYDFLGSRGLNLGDFNSRILLLVDGHRINNNLSDGAFIDTAFILDVDLIDRVEIIRGPGSVLYGNNAFFGVINVVTRRGRQLNGAEVSGEHASWDAYKGRVTYGRSFSNEVQLLLSGTWFDSHGPERLFYEEYDDPASNDGVAENLDGDTFKSFFGSISYRDFTLDGAFSSRDKENPTAQYFTTFNDPRLRTTDQRSYVSLKYAHSFPETVDVNAQVYYDRSDFEIGYPFDPLFFKERQSGEWWGTEIQFSKRIQEVHIVTLGAEYRDDFRQHREVVEPATGTVFTDDNSDRQSHGIYLQGDFQVLTNLHFSGGIRYDHYGDFDPSFNPRLAAIYNPWESSAIKAVYGTAFRAPNFLELSDPRFQDITPEEITSYELIYEQELGRHLRSSVSGFYNEMDNLIVLEDGAFTNFDASTKGLEMALEGNWTNGLRTRLSYTLQKTGADGGIHLPDSPAHLVKANLSVPLYQQKVFAGLEFQYTSTRQTIFTTSTGETLRGADAAGFGIVNFTLFSRDLVENLEFSASLYNLLDKKYGDPSSRFHSQDIIPQNTRSFRLKLTYRF